MPVESINHQETYIIDQIEPILLINEQNQENSDSNNFIQHIDQNKKHEIIEQDYLLFEQQSDNYLDPNELVHRLEQLDLSNKQEIITNLDLNDEQNINFNIEHLTSIVDEIQIVKQGNGFKIGYSDRQGTDQRVILTKRIEAGPDIIERDPHIRLPHKERRLLSQTYSSVLYTNGNNIIQEDKSFQRSTGNIEVPTIGTNPKHFDE
ncbi:unnamed protein product, partial [Rotaria sp. Silwood2]